MRVGIDLSGGDYGASEVIRGVAQAEAANPDLQIIVFAKDDSWRIVEQEYPNTGKTTIRGVGNLPYAELKAAFRSLQEGQIDAFLTASNSRLLLGVARLHFRKGVRRPGLIAPFPTAKGISYLMDVGATIRPTDPEIFSTWLKLGQEFLDIKQGILKASVGLHNIATERAFEELAEIHTHLLNFPGYIGYVEPTHFFAGEVDLLLTDGFTGNTILKEAEALLPLGVRLCAKAITENGYPTIGKQLPLWMKKILSYEGYLISPLLGTKYWVFRMHGRCQAEQISQSIHAIKSYPISTKFSASI